MKFPAIIVFLLSTFLASAQECSDKLEAPFAKGEIMNYELVYNWGLIWARAGLVQFSVRDTVINDQPHFQFYGFGTSMKHWDWFYKVRSSYKSIANAEMTPYYFSRNGQEGSNLYNNEYELRGENCRLTFMDEESVMRSKIIDTPPCTFDVMTAIYYCRSIPFENYKVDDTVPLNMLLDGAVHKSHVRYVGKEKWEDPNTDIVYDCIKFRPLLIEGTVFSQGENMTVWVTDDELRIPVYVETELSVGKAKIFLTGYTPAD